MGRARMVRVVDGYQPYHLQQCGCGMQVRSRMQRSYRTSGQHWPLVQRIPRNSGNHRIEQPYRPEGRGERYDGQVARIAQHSAATLASERESTA